jgi:hypothetical protein
MLSVMNYFGNCLATVASTKAVECNKSCFVLGECCFIDICDPVFCDSQEGSPILIGPYIRRK